MASDGQVSTECGKGTREQTTCMQEPDGVPESIFASVNYNILFCTTLVIARCGSGQLHQRHGSREPRKISRGYR